MRTIRSLVTLGLFLIWASGCSRGLAQDPLAKADTKLGAGFAIQLSMSVRGVDEGELCGRFSLSGQGELELTVGLRPIQKIPLTGLTCELARQRVAASLRRYYSAPPDV